MSDPINLTNADFTFKDKNGNTGSNKSITNSDKTKLNNMVKLLNLLLNTPNSTDFINTLATKVNVATDLNGKADKDFTNIDNTAKIAIAHNSMPSDKYDDLTLGSSGTIYTAPADGFFCFAKQGSINQSIYLTNISSLMSTRSWSGVTNGVNGLAIWIACKKGEQVRAGYEATGVTELFRFIYAVGSESEQV